MAIEVFSGRQALDNHRTNSRSSWPTKSRDANRLQPVARPWYDPTFTIDAGDRVFTMGSCFARNIEEHLADRGFDVTTRPATHDLPHDYTDTYSAYAIRTKMRWALEPGAAPADDFGLYEIGDGAWHDAFANPTAVAEKDVVMGRRARMLEMLRGVKDCRIVVLTLGVAEVWYDENLGAFLNRMPPVNFVRRNPERFSLHMLDHDEILAALNDVHAMLATHGHPDVRILITVSPVPLASTFSDRDVLIANMYAKSAQRAAVERFSRNHDGVDYFPSFESVMLSPRDIAWEDDNRHVTPTAVGANVAAVIRAYAPDLAEPDFEHWYQAGQAHLREKAYQEAERAFSHAVQLDPDAVSALHALGVTLVRMGKFERAEEALGKAIALAPGGPSAESRFQLGMAFLNKGDAEGAVGHFRDAVRLRPKWAITRFHLGTALEDLGRLDEAEAELRTCAETSPDVGFVHFRLGCLQMKRKTYGDAAQSFERAIALPDPNPDAADRLAEAKALAAQAEAG